MKIVLQKLCESLKSGAQGTNSPAEVHQAIDLLEAELSHDQKREALRKAIKIKRVEGDPYRWRYLQDVFESYVVYWDYEDGEESRLMKATYSIDENTGAVTLGTPIEVRQEINYVEIPQATQLSESNKRQINEVTIELKERAIADDGTMLIKIASPGVGSSGRYSRTVLERDIPRVFPKGTHMYADHQTEDEAVQRPEGSIKDLAAVFVETPVYLEEADAPEGEGPYVRVKPFNDYAGMLDDKAQAIGVSLYGSGTATIGEDGVPEITSIFEGRSVDFVTKAGRDGRIISLKESARLSKNSTSTPPPSEAMPNISEAEATQLREAATTAQTENADLKRQLVEAQQAPKVATFIATQLTEASLPDASVEKLTKTLTTKPVFKDGALDETAFGVIVAEAVSTEVAYLQQLGIGTGEVNGNGSGQGEGEGDKAFVRTQESIRGVRALAGL